MAAGVKRNYQRMMMDQANDCTVISMDGLAYHDYHPGYYTPPPPPPQAVLFSNPFPSAHGEYVSEGYIPTSEAMAGFFQQPSNRSFSEPFIHNNTNDSFESHSSGSSSCGASLAPATPPPAPPAFGTVVTKYPAIPITPSHVIPRQKAKRTATACEECRKRKQKCDGETPCQSCKEQKLECKYREVTPTKKDNSLEKLFSLLEGYQKSMDAMTQRVETIGNTLRQIERRLCRCSQCGSSSVELETGSCSSCDSTSNISCRL